MLEHMTPEMIRSDARKAETEIGRRPDAAGVRLARLVPRRRAARRRAAAAAAAGPGAVPDVLVAAYERRMRLLYAGVDLGALSPREGVLR